MISSNCVNIVRLYEGLSLKSYPDPATGGEPYTIGYGSTRYANGDKVKLGEIVTLQEAERLLTNDLERRYNAIKGWLPEKINQNQIDSLVSFVYNCGVGAFEKSTLRKKVWANPNDTTIHNEFMRWTKAAGKVMLGLVKRRQSESKLYYTPITTHPQQNPTL